MGDKPCAFQDLRPFVTSLPPDQVTEFLSCVSQSVGLEDGKSPNNVSIYIDLLRFLSLILFLLGQANLPSLVAYSVKSISWSTRLFK